MLILSKIPHETIWGGKKLLKYSDGNCSKIGHLYSLFDDVNSSNIILNGLYKGKTFHEYFIKNRDKYNLNRYDYYPLVLAIVEAGDDLSIQVHPDDDVARDIEKAPWGKNESWYFMEPPVSGSIYNGCNLDTLEEVQNCLDSGKGGIIADRLKIEKDDYVYVESGTLHSITKGSLVYEIEENSEYTYRFYDFDRTDEKGNKRELHIDKALKALKPEKKSFARKYVEGKAITERMYSTELAYLDNYKNVSDTLECITIIDPQADYTIDGTKLGFGQTIVLEPGEEIRLNHCKSVIARTVGSWDS